MPIGENDLLHRVELGVANPGTYWHVYPLNYSPTASNPNSKARLAWRDGAHGMFYAGDSPAAALWETALRYARVRRGSVYTDSTNLKGMMLARLTLTTAVPVVDLRTPNRRSVVDADCDLDAMWDVVLKRPDHEPTHNVTSLLMAQLANAGHKAGAGLRWHSRQSGADSVLLFFEPPMSSAWWTYDSCDIYPLDGVDGAEQIRLALASQGFSWGDVPAGSEYDPEPGSLEQASEQFVETPIKKV